MYASTDIVNLNLVSQIVQLVHMCKPYRLSLILTTDMKFGVSAACACTAVFVTFP